MSHLLAWSPRHIQSVFNLILEIHARLIGQLLMGNLFAHSCPISLSSNLKCYSMLPADPDQMQIRLSLAAVCPSGLQQQQQQ